ncbi:helicase associated domain-containing protein [Kitasatospora sp. NPDC096140]|uniref:helicase associated domain-containing protein n=1 Tax=Kitasatospora sp. NPDC096140 TaxID=3155425 RepID=UPI0033225363
MPHRGSRRGPLRRPESSAIDPAQTVGRGSDISGYVQDQLPRGKQECISAATPTPVAWAAHHGHLAIPATEKPDGYAVGAWMRRQRKAEAGIDARRIETPSPAPRCRECGTALRVSGPGRRPVYCGWACSSKAYRRRRAEHQQDALAVLTTEVGDTVHGVVILK